MKTMSVWQANVCGSARAPSDCGLAGFKRQTQAIMPIKDELGNQWTELHHLLSDPHQYPVQRVLDAIKKHPEQARAQHDVKTPHAILSRPA